MRISRLASATLAALDVSQADLSILFGPAGSGKTSLARGAARAIFGSSDETLTTPLSPVEVETSGATRGFDNNGEDGDRWPTRLHAIDFTNPPDAQYLIWRNAQSHDSTNHSELCTDHPHETETYRFPRGRDPSCGVTRLRSELAQRTAVYLSRLSSGRWNQIQLSENAWQMTLSGDSGIRAEYSSLDLPQRDQVVLACALALAEFQRQGGAMLPLILDEPFRRQTDDQSVCIATVLLEYARSGQQILVFTRRDAVSRWCRASGAQLRELNPGMKPGTADVSLPAEPASYRCPLERLFNNSAVWDRAGPRADCAGDLLNAAGSANRSLATAAAQNQQFAAREVDISSREAEISSRKLKLSSSRSGSRSAQDRSSSSRRRRRRTAEQTGTTAQRRRRSGRRRRSESRAGRTSQREQHSQKARSASSTTESEKQWRFYLQRSSPVVDAPSIGPVTAERLERIGIVTVNDLLKADPEHAASKLKNRRIKAETIIEWQKQARLVCTVPQLRGHDAQILVECGVSNASKLSKMQPEKLFSVVGPFCQTKRATRYIRSGKRPDQSEVSKWIDWAGHSRSLKAA